MNFTRRFYLLTLLFMGVVFFLKGQTHRAGTSDLYLRSNTCFDLKKYDSAIFYYRQFLYFNIPDTSRISDAELGRSVITTNQQRVQASLRLAFSYNIYCQYDSALQTLYRGLKEISGNGKGNTTFEANYCLQIGTCLLLKRDHIAALDWYKKCLNVTGGKGVIAVDAYQNIGNIDYFKADYENAILNYQKAWINNLALKKRNPIRLYQTLVSLGTAYIENNDPAKGLSCLLNAEKLLKSINPNDSLALAGMYINIGSACYKMNKPDDARINYIKGLQFLKEGQPNEKSARLVAYKGISTLFLSYGHYDSSLFFLRKACSELYHWENHSLNELAGVYCMIGDVFRIRQKYDSAFINYQLALNCILPEHQFPERIIQPRLFHKIDLVELTMVLKKNAEILLFEGIRNGNDSGYLKRSFSLYNQAIVICGEIQRDLGQEGSRLVFNDSSKSVFAGAMEAAFRLWKSGMQEFQDTLFHLAESSREKILVTDLQERMAIKMKGVPDSLIQKQKLLKHEIGLITRKKLKQKNYVFDYPGYSYWTDLEKMIDLNIENDSIIEGFESNIPGFSELKSYHPLMTSSEIQSKLSGNEVLLEYFWADSSLYLFVFTCNSYHTERVSLKKTLLSQIENFLKSIKRADLKKFPDLSHDLYKILIEPVAPYLEGKNHLIIIPDEELSSLPFETLITRKSEIKNDVGCSDFHYMIKDFEISYHLSSAAYMDSKRRTPLRPYYFLGFAPVFNSQHNQTPSFEPLSYSLPEVSTIASLFRSNSHQAEIMSASEATKSRFLKISEKATHLHIATHSVTDVSHPSQLGLALAPEVPEITQKDQVNNILWRDEIENADFQADLLVLSACATGKGKMTKTEGVLALPRSFYLAGVGNILYTLWNIPDRNTKDFMIDFYKGFLSGKSYSAALRATKLKMIARPETSLPYLWSGFVLLGK